MTATQRLKGFRPVFYAIAIVALMWTLFSSSLVSFADTPQHDLENLNKHLDKAMVALQAGNTDSARTEFKAFNDGWYNIEDSVKAQSSQTYRDIETAMSDVKVALATQPLDTAKVTAAIQHLDAIGDKFINATGANASSNTATTDQNVTVKSQVAYLDTALNALTANNTTDAAKAVAAFQNNWPSIETLVMAKSASIYSATENNMALVRADLQSNPVKLDEAKSVLAQVRADLAPFVENNSYGIFDATIVLLREGLEALLVVAALLAFLTKSGNSRKQSAVWTGAGIGLALSIVVAVLVEVFFSTAAAGTNRELLEGVTGLVAASMLFYMSYWLHSKAQVGAWQKYIKSKATTALATGSAFSLGLLAFLAVFREGSETAILYIGIAPSIAFSDLLIGVGIGVALLVVLALFILVIGVKLPMRPFFTVASLLVFYIGFKFIGTGIHSLQVAQVLPAHSANYLPSIDFFGIFPTWETTIAQVALLALAVILWAVSKRHIAQQQAKLEAEKVRTENKADNSSPSKTGLAPRA